MASAYLGEIQIFAGKIPTGWVLCDGRQLPMSSYDKLFGLLGTTYGGNGTTTFALPDLRGRVPISFGQGGGLGNYSLGQLGGEEQHALTQAEIPLHSHFLQALPYTGTTNTPANTCILGISTGLDPNNKTLAINLYTDQTVTILQPMDPHTITGPAAPHENRMPYVAVNYCIYIQGNNVPPT
jgi:microcystin-dependent protein